MISKDELIQALQNLSPEQLQGILGQGHGRSPIRPRQLHDLTLKPTATDPRPTFYTDTDGREFHPITHSPYPRLMWHTGTGQEITVRSEDEMRAKLPTYTVTPPISKPLDPADEAARMFAALSDEDKKFVLEAQRQARLARVNAVMADLTEGQAAQVMAGVETKKARKES